MNAEWRVGNGEESVRRWIELQERERQWLGFELHDGLVQELTAATMFLEAAAVESEASGVAPPASLAEGCRLVRSALVEARRLIAGLEPAQLEADGFRGAIERLADEFRQRSPICLTLNLAVLPRMPRAWEWSLFRILQECLNNVARHSKAQRAEVRFESRGDELSVTVRDDGVGFDVHHVPSQHYGLLGVRQRVEWMHGTISVESSAGGGTTVVIRLALPESVGEGQSLRQGL